MQFAAKYGLKSIVTRLLADPEVDPNFCEKTHDQEYRRPSLWPQRSQIEREISKESSTTSLLNPSNETNYCKKHPIILAAEYAQPEVLMEFKKQFYHTSANTTTLNEESENGTNQLVKTKAELKDNVSFDFSNEENKEESKDNETVIVKRRNSESAKDTSPSKSRVRFDVISEENKETVLHVALRQPILEQQRIWERNESMSKKASENRNSLDNITYESLPSLRLQDRKLQDLSKDYRDCINILLDTDRFKGNEKGDKAYVKQLRAIINNKNSRDNGKNTALHYAVSNWPGMIAEKLLGLGANPSLKNKYEEIPLGRITKATFESFLDKRCIFVDEFDPSDNEMEEDGTKDESAQNISQDYDQSFMMKISRCGEDRNNKMTFDYTFLRPPKALKDENALFHHDSLKDDDSESLGERELSKVSEMDVLFEMSKSEEHRLLITHPVIDSFLWAKWKLMTKFNNRMLRIRFLFLYSILWNTFTTFGGYNWMNIELNGDNISRSIANENFCKDSYHYQNVTTVWNQDYFGPPYQLSTAWYYFFYLIVFTQFLLMLRDYSVDSDERVAVWIDIFNLALSTLILFCGKTVLWLVITLLLVFYTLSEIAEFFAVRKKYFWESSNYFDMAMIILTFVVLYVPQEIILNSNLFSIKHGSEKGSGCEVKRSMSAFIIVLVWSRFLMSLAQCPFLKEYNLYLIMFTKVIRRYGKIMLWFACYIIAFGLGFYIMLHNDTKIDDKMEKKENSTYCIYDRISRKCILDFPNMLKTEDDKTKFDAPFLALIKTGTMFIGELDFDDLPLDGGNVSVSAAYIFLIAFIFLIIIVMVNLLNGLAVSDTQQMINDSKIETQVSFIEAIRYFESVYLDAGKLPNCFGKLGDKDIFCVNRCFRTIFPMKLFLFTCSKHIKDNKLVFPLQEINVQIKNQDQNKKRNNSVICKFINWLTKRNPNFGSEDFLKKARKILIRLKKAKEAERKQKRLKEEIKKLEERQMFERLRNETYFEQTQNMETMLQQLVSKLMQDYE